MQIGKYYVNISGKRAFIKTKVKGKDKSIMLCWRYITLRPVAEPPKPAEDTTPWIAKRQNRLPEQVVFTISQRKGRTCFTDGRDKKSLSRSQLKAELDRMLNVDAAKLIQDAVDYEVQRAA